ncbi:leucine-rich repeat domain-containing protein [Flagellimonas sp. GZD32]|uniref:leucine-rich repeat domain-containing protein n=1 Tax=Flagellimonas cixiensis TaxID=3228750 RepID=UPI0035C92D51
MRKACAFLFFLCLFISCSESEETSTPNIPETPDAIEQGAQSFGINNKKITSKNSTDFTAKEFIPSYVFVSVETGNGSIIMDRQKLDVIDNGGDFVTEEILLDPGTYKLTEFIVIDSADEVISLVPKATSALSQFTGTSLPYDFTVQEADSKNTPIENIEAAGYSWVEFGYEEDDMVFSEAEDFFTLTVDDSENLTAKVIALKSLTGSTYQIDWGDGTIEEYVSTLNTIDIENEVSHTYEENGIYEIKIIGAVEVIEYLNFSNYEVEFNNQSNIIAAELGSLTLLKEVDFHIGKLTSLDTSSNLLLENLSLGYNQITHLDLSNNGKLRKLYVRFNQLTEIDVTQNPYLELLWVNGNQISNLDVTNNSLLQLLFVRDNNLTGLDVSQNSMLNQIDLSGNSISNIDVTQNIGLFSINVGANYLTEIDLTKNTNLERIDLYNNQLSSLDISKNVELRALYLNDNMLSELDLSQNSELERLIIQGNNFSQIDISQNPRIFDLEIGANQFLATELDQMISLVYNQAILNSTTSGYIDFQNNPGTDLIDQTTIAKINELGLDYNWTFNNNQY